MFDRPNTFDGRLIHPIWLGDSNLIMTRWFSAAREKTFLPIVEWNGLQQERLCT
jgi:hypothetical protein